MESCALKKKIKNLILLCINVCFVVLGVGETKLVVSDVLFQC